MADGTSEILIVILGGRHGAAALTNTYHFEPTPLEPVILHVLVFATRGIVACFHFGSLLVADSFQRLLWLGTRFFWQLTKFYFLQTLEVSHIKIVFCTVYNVLSCHQGSSRQNVFLADTRSIL